MRVHCHCFGLLPAASSRRPVKRYNLLVPDIFPRNEPPFQDKVDSSIDRKIKKLADYLNKNPHRGPKVSRRLARKVQKELRAHRYGYVKLAVRAYMHLLEALKNDDSSLFAKELVVQPVDKHVDTFTDKVGGHVNSVIGLLLRHNKAEIRILGARLLAQFEKVQVDSDYVDQLEHFVPMVCSNCEAHPVGLYDPAPEHLRILHIACMQALRQHLAMAHRVSFTSRYLEAMMKVTLSTLAQPLPEGEAAEDLYDAPDVFEPPLRHSIGQQPSQQPITDAAAGTPGEGLAVGHPNKISPVNGPTAHVTAHSRPSALHHATSGHADGTLQHKRLSDDRHVQINDARSRNGGLEPAFAPNSNVEQLSHPGAVDVRSSLTSWLESARSKLGLHSDDELDRPPDKTTGNRGQAESTSEAINAQRDSIGSKPALHQDSLTISNASMTNQSAILWRGNEAVRASLERRDSTTSSAYIASESPHAVAQRLLEDLARMTKDAQAGRNVIDCLLRYLDKGSYWTDSSSLRNVAIGILRKVCAEEHQRYLLFSSLLRHVSSAGLDTAQQAAVVDLAAAEGRALEGGLASPALVLAVKDLSPVLPGPAVQDAAQAGLRRAVLQCISDMARRVGDSLHLLEALGGVVGKLQGPTPLTTAVLECVAAAAMAVNYFSPKARVLPSRTFPQVFLHHMMGMCAAWEVPQRLLVHSCLVTLLPVATDGLKDTQLHGLLSTIWHEVAIPSNPPSMFSSLDSLLRTSTESCSPAALVNTMRMLFTLKAEVLESSPRLSGLSSAQCCAVLLLHNSSLMRFGQALQSPQLLDLTLQIPPEACPQLRAVNQELQLANQAPFSPTDEASAVRTLQRLKQTQRGRDSFHSMANLVSSHSHISSAYTDSRLWADADKPFLPLSLAVLQPKLKAGSQGPGSPAGPHDSSSRAMQRLKDMYARNTSTHEQDRPPQPQGVKQLLQASMAEAEQETLEDAMITNQERHYMNVAAECKVSKQTLQSLLEDIEAKSSAEDGSTASLGQDASSLLPCSNVHRLGCVLSDLTLYST